MRLYLQVGTIACVLAFASSLNAQLPSGSIGGITKDPSGRLIQGAHITVTNERQGTMREGTTGADGSFTLSIWNLEAIRW
jgi:hypothetical protein